MLRTTYGFCLAGTRSPVSLRPGGALGTPRRSRMLGESPRAKCCTSLPPQNLLLARRVRVRCHDLHFTDRQKGRDSPQTASGKREASEGSGLCFVWTNPQGTFDEITVCLFSQLPCLFGGRNDPCPLPNREAEWGGQLETPEPSRMPPPTAGEKPSPLSLLPPLPCVFSPPLVLQGPFLLGLGPAHL